MTIVAPMRMNRAQRGSTVAEALSSGAGRRPAGSVESAAVAEVIGRPVSRRIAERC